MKFAGEQISEHELAQMLAHEGAAEYDSSNEGGRSEQEASAERLDDAVAASDPQLVDAGVLWAGLDRAELRKQFAAGELAGAGV